MEEKKETRGGYNRGSCKICNDAVLKEIVNYRLNNLRWTPNKVMEYLKNEKGIRISINTILKHKEVCLKGVTASIEEYMKLEAINLIHKLEDGEITPEEFKKKTAFNYIVYEYMFSNRVLENPLKPQIFKGETDFIKYIKDYLNENEQYTHVELDTSDDLIKEQKMKAMLGRVGNVIKTVNANDKIEYIWREKSDDEEISDEDLDEAFDKNEDELNGE